MAERGDAPAARRDVFVTVMAALFALLAGSNFTKAIQHLYNPGHLGIVVFGVRLEETGSNLIVEALMGVALAVYAHGLWNLRRWVMPVSIAYAFYVPTNLVLFWYRQTGPDVPPLGFLLAYLAVAFTGSIGTALHLAYHRDALA